MLIYYFSHCPILSPIPPSFPLDLSEHARTVMLNIIVALLKMMVLLRDSVVPE